MQWTALAPFFAWMSGHGDLSLMPSTFDALTLEVPCLASTPKIDKYATQWMGVLPGFKKGTPMAYYILRITDYSKLAHNDEKTVLFKLRDAIPSQIGYPITRTTQASLGNLSFYILNGCGRDLASWAPCYFVRAGVYVDKKLYDFTFRSSDGNAVENVMLALRNTRLRRGLEELNAQDVPIDVEGLYTPGNDYPVQTPTVPIPYLRVGERFEGSTFIATIGDPKTDGCFYCSFATEQYGFPGDAQIIRGALEGLLIGSRDQFPTPPWLSAQFGSKPREYDQTVEKGILTEFNGFTVSGYYRRKRGQIALLCSINDRWTEGKYKLVSQLYFKPVSGR